MMSSMSVMVFLSWLPIVGVSHQMAANATDSAATNSKRWSKRFLVVVCSAVVAVALSGDV
jgi:hypothetical protein